MKVGIYTQSIFDIWDNLGALNILYEQLWLSFSFFRKSYSLTLVTHNWLLA